MDIRYHLASLVAVFLALGLGILTGTSLSSDNRLLKEQAALIGAIEQQLGQLRDERTKLETSLAEVEGDLGLYKGFASDVLPQLVAGQLQGLTVAVVGFDCEHSAGEVEETLRLAGAGIVGSAFVWPEEAEKPLLFAGVQPESPVVRALVAGLSMALPLTEEAPPSVHWRQPLAERAERIVLVGKGALADTALRTALALQQRRTRVVLAGVGTSWVGSMRGAGLPVVERVDTPMGQVELVKSLASGR